MNLTSLDGDNVLYYGLSGYGITLSYFCILLVFLFVAITTIFFNGIIIYILFHTTFKDDISCILITHLAISDCFSGIFLIYNIIYNLIHYKIFYECVFRFGLVNGILLNSAVIVFMLTIERYLKIVSPLRYVDIVSPKRAQLSAVLNWFICILFCQTPLFGWHPEIPVDHCGYFEVLPATFLFIFGAVLFTMLIFIFIMYCHILVIAVKQSKLIVQTDENCGHKHHKHFWWKPTKTALIIVSVNVVCWLPSGIYVLLVSIGHLDYLTVGEKGTLLTYVSSPIYINGIGNPLIYAFNIAKIRRRILKMLKCSECRTVKF